jgi:hypothetical protein
MRCIMKRIMVGVVLVASGATFVAAFGDPPPLSGGNQNSASGHGSMSFGEHGDSVGLIEFDVGGGRSPSGSLLFAAEDHHRYPGIIVRLEKITRAAFGRRTVRFSGQGALHDDPVTVTVFAFDGEGTAKPDRFSIKCVNGQGKVVFKARGELFNGDIRVGQPS